MNDSRKTATDVIKNILYELMYGEDCIRGVSFGVIHEHVKMYRMFILWSKKTHKKFLVRNSVFDHNTPVSLIKNIYNVNTRPFLSDRDIHKFIDNYKLTNVETQWLSIPLFFNYEKCRGMLNLLFESWMEFIKYIKQNNII